MPGRKHPERVILVNMGGIGDTILFSPVIDAVRNALPQAPVTLLVEHRSRASGELIAGIDAVKTITLTGKSRIALAIEFISILRQSRADLVISSGSSPQIAGMLLLSGIPVRIGFDSGHWTRKLLTRPAPLNKSVYAADMYFSLARAFYQVYPDLAPATIPAGVIPELALPPADYLKKGAQWLHSDREGRRKILIHPGSSRMSVEKHILKFWSADRWAELIRQLAPDNDVFLVGGPDDAETVQTILAQLKPPLDGFTNLYGQTKNILDLSGLIANADVLVSVDSAPMHLAVGLGTPVVAFFGPTDPKKLLPKNSQNAIAVHRQDLVCRPCLWDHRTISCDSPVCLDVPVEQYKQAIETRLSVR